MIIFWDTIITKKRSIKNNKNIDTELWNIQCIINFVKKTILITILKNDRHQRPILNNDWKCEKNSQDPIKNQLINFLSEKR